MSARSLDILPRNTSGAMYLKLPVLRGLHSSTSQLNLSAFHAMGGARRGRVARVKGMLWGFQGILGYFVVSDTAQVELTGGRV
jgi:hypothetical protein